MKKNILGKEKDINEFTIGKERNFWIIGKRLNILNKKGKFLYKFKVKKRFKFEWKDWHQQYAYNEYVVGDEKEYKHSFDAEIQANNLKEAKDKLKILIKKYRR